MLEMNKISCFADEIDTDIHKQIEVLEKLSINQIEFRSANGKNVSEYTIDEAKALKVLLEKHDIGISALGSPIGKILITDDFRPHFETFRHVVELVKILDTHYIRMFSFFIPENGNPYDYRDEVMKRMEKMVTYAAGQHVVLLHENEKDIYGDTAPRCLELFQRFYGDSFKAVFDFANFVQCKQDTLEAYEILKPYIEYLHIKDALWDSGDVVPAGQGDGHVKEILRLLEKSGYEGYLSLEPHLTDFAGYQLLEKEKKLRSEWDGETAFTAAYDALMGMII